MKTTSRFTVNGLIFGGTAIWGLALVGCMMVAPGTNNPPLVAGANYIGSAQCAMCHDDVVAEFHDRTHSHLVNAGAGGFELGCESCHGAGSLHADSGGDPSLIVSSMQTCVSCHQDVQARFSMAYRHPLNEGMMTCATCHEPHGDKQSSLTSVNQSCTSCHQNLRGPHVFEHPPAAENCTNCHNPHGSPIRSMLTMSQPMLCLQCHSITNNRHGLTGANTLGTPISAAALRNCTSCHSQVHGSSADQHMRY